MDFTPTEAQLAIIGVATDALSGVDVADEDAGWAALVSSQLLNTLIPESAGGDGLDAFAAVELLTQVGRSGLDLPVLGTLALVAVLEQFGSPAQRAEHLPAIAAGQSVFPLALAEPGCDAVEDQTASAVATTGGWSLEGIKVGVPFAKRAKRLLVTAQLPYGHPGLFLVAPTAAGVVLHEEMTTTGAARWTVELRAAEVSDADAVVARGAATLLVRHSLLHLAALQIGYVGRALDLAAAYTSEREQFGRKVASFQAVACRLADAFIDLEALRWTTYDAAHALVENRDDVDVTLAVAKFWAAEGGHRIVSTAQHVHGGIGIDTDYPLHRYFLRAKEIEFALGGASAQLATVWTGLSARVSADGRISERAV